MRKTHHRIVIETCRDLDPGCVRGSVAQGPPFLRDYCVKGVGAADTVATLKAHITDDWPDHTFEFIHHEA